MLGHQQSSQWLRSLPLKLIALGGECCLATSTARDWADGALNEAVLRAGLFMEDPLPTAVLSLPGAKTSPSWWRRDWSKSLGSQG